MLCDFHEADFSFVGARQSLPFAGFALPLENTKGDVALGALPRGALPLRMLRSTAHAQYAHMRMLRSTAHAHMRTMRICA